MTTTTLTLADFLLARIAEDEAAARDTTDGPWRERLYFGEHQVVDPDDDVVAVGDLHDQDMRHIARWDPARVLAECEAKRRIVSDAQCVLVRRNGEWVSRLDGVMRHLALPYANHPDYRDEWAA